MRNARQKRGSWGEGVARGYLSEKGYEILGQNIRSPFGEIDLVCAQGKELVIVEVKTRRSIEFGYPEEAVTVAKQRKLRQLAEWYWRSCPQYLSVRVDVLALYIEKIGNAQIEHIRNAL